MSSFTDNSAVFDQISRLGKAFSSATRLEIIHQLSQAPRTVDSLADSIGQSTANTSHHLQKLREVRLVEAKRDGVHMIYRLADEEVVRAYQMLRHLAEARLFEVQEFLHRFFDERDQMESVDPDQLLERVRQGEVTVVDVRSDEEYQAGHLPGAVCIPLEQLEERISELPRDRQVVAYCRGPFCALSLDAVDLLRDNGFEARRLSQGVPDWKQEGLPVEHGRPGR